jgi:hypothetical protein
MGTMKIGDPPGREICPDAELTLKTPTRLLSSRQGLSADLPAM